MELTGVVVAPLRGMLIAAVATLAIAAPVSIAPTLMLPPPERCAIDAHLLRADHLAWTIEQRRYGEIEAAAAAIGADSPYARWVPAAIGLAIEQLDATAAAHAAMHRCSDLHRFLKRIAIDWPAGRAAMKRVRCEGDFVCGSSYPETAVAIAIAVAARDHATALASCADIRDASPMLPACVAAACRAGDLATAETLAAYADAEAIRACSDAGVTFTGGLARSAGYRQPVELVHVHPDAPATARALW